MRSYDLTSQGGYGYFSRQRQDWDNSYFLNPGKRLCFDSHCVFLSLPPLVSLAEVAVLRCDGWATASANYYAHILGVTRDIYDPDLTYKMQARKKREVSLSSPSPQRPHLAPDGDEPSSGRVCSWSIFIWVTASLPQRKSTGLQSQLEVPWTG
jgi:hypothetical protein